jgi:hypothetical protein
MIEPASNLLGVNQEIRAMGLFFPVYPETELFKLNDEERKKLIVAIRLVLKTDPEVQNLLRQKTAKTFADLLDAKSTVRR